MVRVALFGMAAIVSFTLLSSKESLAEKGFCCLSRPQELRVLQKK